MDTQNGPDGKPKRAVSQAGTGLTGNALLNERKSVAEEAAGRAELVAHDANQFLGLLKDVQIDE